MENEVKSVIEGFQNNVLGQVEAAKAEWKSHAERLTAAGADTKEVKTMVERAIKRMDALEAELSRGNVHTDLSPKSIGQRFIEDQEVQGFLKKGWHKGSTGIHIKSFMEFPEFHPDGLKTTITSSTVGSSTPGILVPERMPGIVKPGVRRLRVRDLMPRFQTQNNAVEFVKENAFTNNASPTAETISKPESALTFTIDSATVKTVAHWIPMAKQVRDDFSALQGYVEQRLLEGLKDIEDYELVAGDGTGQHLSGLSTEATAYDTARNVSGDTYLDKLNHAISQIEDVLHYADGIIMHPRDWRAIQLIKTEDGGANTGNYLLGGPGAALGDTAWGLPVATTTAVTQGTFYVGAFRLYTAVWDRMTSRIDISTEHADYFIRNMLAVLAEERIAFTVTRSDAVVYGSF